MIAVCPLCPHHCHLQDGQLGICRARTAHEGKVVPISPDLMSAISLDPIEKKPLAFFHPGQMILSLGGYGCNMHCSFCQNSDISFSAVPQADVAKNSKRFSPEELVELAQANVPHGNIGIAFTYNEPLVRYEYILDCFRLAKHAGLATVLVSNGCFERPVIEALAEWTDAWNIDLKAFSEKTYLDLGGDFNCVKRAISIAAEKCHVEVTTLIVPGMNDEPAEMYAEAAWLASISPDLVLHLTRFFPRHQMLDRSPTGIKNLIHLRDIASQYLNHVLLGNV